MLLAIFDERLSEALVEHHEHGPEVLSISAMAAFPLIGDVIHEVGHCHRYRPELLDAELLPKWRLELWSLRRHHQGLLSPQDLLEEMQGDGVQFGHVPELNRKAVEYRRRSTYQLVSHVPVEVSL